MGLRQDPGPRCKVSSGCTSGALIALGKETVVEECPEQNTAGVTATHRASPSAGPRLMQRPVLLLSDLLEVGADCTDPWPSGWSRWPREAPLGEVQGNSCPRL